MKKLNCPVHPSGALWFSIKTVKAYIQWVFLALVNFKNTNAETIDKKVHSQKFGGRELQ
jgi:hypothetical protein